MPYSRQQKLKALTLLRANHGNVQRASLSTGIPESILRRWKAHLHQQSQRTHKQTMRELFDLALAAEDERAATSR